MYWIVNNLDNRQQFVNIAATAALYMCKAVWIMWKEKIGNFHVTYIMETLVNSLNDYYSKLFTI